MNLQRHGTVALSLLLLIIADPAGAAAAGNNRARDLGIPFEGSPGPLNAMSIFPEIDTDRR